MKTVSNSAPEADPEQLLHQCRVLTTKRPDFRKALLELWAKSSPADDPEECESLAQVLGDNRIVHALRARSDVGDSVMYAHRVFAEIDFLACQYAHGPLQAVLEIGPGTNLGALFCFVASGVPYAAGIDVQELPPIPSSFYPTLKDYLACVEGFAWWRYFTTQHFPHVLFPTKQREQSVEEILQKIDHHGPVSTTPLPFTTDSFDLIYSVSALEHISEPEQMTREMRRLLRPGAISVHEIGLQHHGSADPLQFLTWSEEEYAARAQPYGDGVSLRRILDQAWRGEIFCNRLRQTDWEQIFQEAQFTILHREPIVLLEPEAVKPERFADPFKAKSLEDLCVLGVRLVARCEK